MVNLEVMGELKMKYQIKKKGSGVCKYQLFGILTCIPETTLDAWLLGRISEKIPSSKVKILGVDHIT